MVPHWSTTAHNNIIEIWFDGLKGAPSYEGNQFAGLNAHFKSTLIKIFTAEAGVAQMVSFAHRGKHEFDIMSVEIEAKNVPYKSLGDFLMVITYWSIAIPQVYI